MSASQPRILVVGAGGLGGPVLLSLAGHARWLAFCDDDRVELSNLQRQIQFRTEDVGRPKVAAMADALVRRGADPARIAPLEARFSADTAPALLASADVVIDGSDNFATKFAVNDACVAARLPFAIGGVMRYQGQLLSAVPGQTGCYRCVFEGPPDDDDAADSCATAGVLGAAVGIVAGHLAAAALALAAGETGAAGRLTVFDDLVSAAAPRSIDVRPRAGCSACGQRAVKEAV